MADRLVAQLDLDLPAAVVDDDAFADDLAYTRRAVEDTIRAGAIRLARSLKTAIGQGQPLTDIGDRVATPLQTQRVSPSEAGRSLASGEAFLPAK